MSADAIDVCPSCGERELREFFEFYSDAALRKDWDARPVEVTADYSCTCRACGYEDAFKFTHRYAGVAFGGPDMPGEDDLEEAILAAIIPILAEITPPPAPAAAPSAPGAPWPAPPAAGRVPPA